MKLEDSEEIIFDGPLRCVQCNASFVGGPIPERVRDLYYGGKTHFSRRIGLSDYDRIFAYRCPDCGHVVPREVGGVG